MENRKSMTLSNISDYTQIADTYDKNRFSGERGAYLYDLDRCIVRELVTRTNASSILDVPVGTGRVLDYLRDLPVQIVGCDATPAMLNQAKAHADEQHHTLQLADASCLPFESASFDCVISLRFFHLFPPEQRHVFAKEFTRVLKPNGYILCSFTNGWYGGGLNWLWKYLGYPSVHFLHINELSRLFPRFSVQQIRGNFLPLQSRLALRIPWLDRPLRKATCFFPLNRLCWEQVYLLQSQQALCE
jgi:ubiquinone/menaquinone biosynthesis C-methylase UbiE